MNEPISLKEILAVIIRRGRSILCFAVIAAILAGAYQFKIQFAAYKDPANSPENIEAAYQKKLASYEADLAELNKQLDTAKQTLKRQKSYNENSVLMQIDPYNSPADTILLAITDVEESAVRTELSEDEEIDYRTGKIQNFYKLYWASLILSEELAGSAFADIPEPYLRELVSVKISDGGTFTISSRGKTVAEAAALGDIAYQCLLDMHQIIEDNTYSHNLTLITRSTKTNVDEKLQEKQEEALASVKEKTAQVQDLKHQIKSLEEPVMGTPYSKKTVVIESAKWAVLGAFVGIVLACLWILILFLMRSRAESSRQMERILGIAFLGSVAKKGSIWERMTRKLLGERVWKDADTAAAFIAQSVTSAVEPGAPLAVLTTLNTKDAEAALAAVSEAVSPVCAQISCVKNAEKNPDAVALLRDCKTVLLAERPGVSNTPEIRSLIDMAQKQGVRIVGFVTV